MRCVLAASRRHHAVRARLAASCPNTRHEARAYVMKHGECLAHPLGSWCITSSLGGQSEPSHLPSGFGGAKGSNNQYHGSL